MRLSQAVLVIFAISSSYQHEIEKRDTKQERRVVCYYTNWSVYRPGTAKFNPQNINPYLCTHLIYAFGGLDRENGLRPYDKYQDIEQGGYAKFTGLKTYNKALKTMLAIGGWNEGSARFSPLVADEDRRKEFVKNVVKFLRVNHFDGLDLDWEYPAFRDGGKPRDKDNYAQLVQELREEFERESSKTGRPRLLLTMAVPAGLEYIDKGYDIPKLNRYLDFMNILSYDYHSAFEPSINHHSPLYSLEEEGEYNFDSQLSIDATVKHYLLKGADANKLVLGIPTYGRSYTLFNEDSTDIGSPSDGPGEQGDATREKGYLAYYEICANVKNGWTVKQPKESAMGPYAYKGNQWVGYDDEAIVKKKAQYVNEKNLGGIMFWSIDNDDFRGKCSSRPYPLIEAAKEALIGKLVNSNKLPSAPRGKSSLKTGKSKTPRTTTSPPTQTPTVTTPDPPTTPDPGSDFVCKDEGFFPHPRDCKKYFWCLDSGPSNLGIVAHQFTCPSGLFFNKAADSCDFARNVPCKKKSVTTTTTESTKATSASQSNSKTTTRTTTTTTTTTTEAPPEEEEEDYFDEKDEEDPQTIKQLITLIKKLGGVAELEKQLEGGSSGTEIDSTTPSISKSLYNRVISRPTKYQPFQRNGPSGPQNEGLPRETGRSSSRKEKPKYVTIRRERPSTSTTESLDSEDYEEEVEEERPQYRARGSQTEGLEIEKPVERPRPKYQPADRFRSKSQDRQTQDESRSSDRSTTLRYSNIFRSRSTPLADTTATTSRYVTLQRHRNRHENESTTENELNEEEESTEELVETTTTPRPRIKVSDVLTTTPGVLTSTRVVTHVVEGATQRQRVPLHKLQQLLKDSENLIETVTKPYQAETTEEPYSRRPILNSFQKKRPEIIFTTTVRTTPAYIAIRRNKYRTSSSTTTEPSEVTKRSRGFTLSRNRFRSTTEASQEEEKPVNRFSPRQRFRFRNDSSTEKSTLDQLPTTESSQTTKQFTRSKNRYFNIRRTTQKSSTTERDEEEEGLLSREFSRESNVIRRPFFKPSTKIENAFNTTRASEQANNKTTSSDDVSPYPIYKHSSLSTTFQYELNSTTPNTLTTTTPMESLLTKADLNVTTATTSTNTISQNENEKDTTTIQPSTEQNIIQFTTILHREKAENESKIDQETSSNDVLLKLDITEKPQLIRPRNRTKIILRKTKHHENHNDSLSSGTESSGDVFKNNLHKKIETPKISHEKTFVNPALRNKLHDNARVVIRRRKPETGKSIQFKENSTKNSIDPPASPQRVSRGKTKFSGANSYEELPKRREFVRTNSEGTPNHRRVIVRGRKKFTEDISTEATSAKLNQSSQKQNITHPTSQYLTKHKGKVRRVVLKKTIKDLAVGESGIPGSQEDLYDNNDNTKIRGALKIWDSLAQEEVDNYFNDDDETIKGEKEISRARRPLQRRPTSRSTTTTTTEAPTTARQFSTIHSLKQRLNRFKTEKNKPSFPNTRVTTSTAAPRKSEFRRVVKPVTESVVENSQLENSAPKGTFAKTTQYHRETLFKPSTHLTNDDILYHTTQIEEQATESSFTDEHITDEHGEITFHEINSQDEEPISDLANVAVAAIQSLATSPPTQATQQYKVTTTRPTTKHVTHKIRTRPTRPPTVRPVSTTPIIIPSRGLLRSSPRPFSKATHSSRNLPVADPVIYDDYEDYYAEPVDVPLSGKVRIHNDGYIECLDIGNFPHPFSCRKFISCAKMENGHLLGWEYTCPKGLSFDPIGGICNWNAGLGCKE
ncbi:uncharacterized protein LOC106663599 isoform X1 [Cimex lectularius]|uniref:Chitinase n=1 Tax=Cimex lectularius TaxID=79782 RepID=A0A8I6RF52_CIMLE|nr:uncharacterized protein LOC106663599 isoform X1 [Cimex lectularius]